MKNLISIFAIALSLSLSQPSLAQLKSTPPPIEQETALVGACIVATIVVLLCIEDLH